VQISRDQVTYFHVELLRHAVILAEGLTVESYLDIGDRMDFTRNGEAVRLFPDFMARPGNDSANAWETRGAAPLAIAGETLAAARRTVRRPHGRAPHPGAITGRAEATAAVPEQTCGLVWPVRREGGGVTG
jgi:hypothetical protein